MIYQVYHISFPPSLWYHCERSMRPMVAKLSDENVEYYWEYDPDGTEDRSNYYLYPKWRKYQEEPSMWPDLLKLCYD